MTVRILYALLVVIAFSAFIVASPPAESEKSDSRSDGVIAPRDDSVTLLSEEEYSRLGISIIYRYIAGSVSQRIESEAQDLFGERRMALGEWLVWNATEAKWSPTTRRPTRRIDQSGMSVVLEDKEHKRQKMSYVAFSLYDTYALATVWDGKKNLSYRRDRCERDTKILDAMPFVGSD